MPFADLFVNTLGTYLALGLAFALPFVAFGVGRVDPDARRGSLGFRLLILPGATLLWPLLLRRWMRGTGPPEERTPHKSRLTESER